LDCLHDLEPVPDLLGVVFVLVSYFLFYVLFLVACARLPVRVTETVTERFAPSSVRPGRIQRHTILSFMIVKLRLTTFIKANYDDDPTQLKPKRRGRNVRKP